MSWKFDKPEILAAMIAAEHRNVPDWCRTEQIVLAMARLARFPLDDEEDLLGHPDVERASAIVDALFESLGTEGVSRDPARRRLLERANSGIAAQFGCLVGDPD